mgnify:FL=1
MICRNYFGAESWWSIIENPEELKDITDDDINSQWYVKALKAMHKEEPEETIEEKLKRIFEAVKEHPENLKLQIRFGLEDIMPLQNLLMLPLKMMRGCRFLKAVFAGLRMTEMLFLKVLEQRCQRKL